MNDKKIVVLGGGTGQSVLLSGLKRFPFDITAVVSVCDDGKSTGVLREEFNVPAMGDIRRVLIALSETEDIVGKLVNYRFKTNGNFDGHTVGNFILTALTDIYGSMSEGIKHVTKILNLKGTVLPLTDDCVTLMGEMEDDSIVKGEHNITLSDKKIKRVYYKKQPKVNKDVIKKIKEADAIVLSMGSVFTSIIPNLICKKVIEAIDESDAEIIYVCNLFTQPGETDGFKVSDHIKLLNSYLGKKKISTVITNNAKINKRVLRKYETEEQKDLVLCDEENLNIEVVQKPLVTMADGTLKHDSVKLGLEIMNILTK
jgi:uncharacterized cofD-like protein